MRRLQRATGEHVLRWTTGLALCALLSCCGAGTAGKLVDVELMVMTEQEPGREPGTFTTQTGFEVVLSEAKVALASILVYAPENEARSSLRAFWLGRARAHGGFDPFNGRRVRLEYAEPLTVDLLADEPRSLGMVTAESGAIASTTLLFADRVEGRLGQAYVRGTATRDGEQIAFEGALALDDEALLRRVDGVHSEGELAAGGTLTLLFKPKLWFDEAHFERLESAADGERQITPSTQVHTAWSFGARSTKAYTTEWSRR